MTADEHLSNALRTIQERGTTRDQPGGERSMQAAVGIFNAATGRDLSEEEGWKFMLALKLARQRAGRFHLDDYVDLIGYAALLAEAAEQNTPR